ncbi:MAG: fibronectin type III-like domain-contianing protein [Prevotellaceae bacterium]|nr:fibronectin type III-like domain-contianing protein [Candidatus Minthosoma equi]
MKCADGENPKSADLLAKFAANQKAIPEPLSNAHLNTSFDARTHGGKGNEQQVYAEDIFVGYRYFDTKKQPVVFPFGYGLSYTTFAYSNAKISGKQIAEGSTLTVSIDVKNTGSVAGKEVVQLYIGDDKASVVRPAKELKHFQKVALNPGETKTVTFTITTDDLKFFDEDKHEWVAESGTFKAYVGASVADIKAVLPFTL